MDIERAKAVAQVADKIIQAAKVEVDFYEVTGQSTAGTFFLGSPFGLNGEDKDKPNGNGRLLRPA